MSMPTQTEKKQLMAVLSDSAELIYHPEMVSGFVSFNNSLLKKTPPDPRVWSLSMANGYLKDSSGRSCVNVCWKACIESLRDQDPVLPLASFIKRGAPIDPSVADVVRSAKEFLLARPDDIRWLALVYFCYSRMIAINSMSAFESNQWGDGEFFMLAMEKSFNSGNGKEFMYLLAKESGKYFQSKEKLQLGIAKNASVGLATMAALEPSAAFFQSMKIH